MILFLLKWGLGLVLALILLYSVLTHFLMVVELRLRALSADQPFPFSALHLLKSFALETGCTVWNVLLSPFRVRTLQRLSEVPPSEGIPILLVHGYLHHQIAWLWFTRQLQKRSSLGPCYSLSLRPFFASIPELAVLVQQEVERILKETGAPQLIIVGHSMGGLISAYCAEYLMPTQVACVISLGTPFKGTQLAALGYGANAKDMLPSAPFLKDLEARLQTSPRPYYSVASQIDNIVIPWQSALLERAPNQQLILSDHGHLRLLMSKRVLNQVVDWIQTLPTPQREHDETIA